LTEVVAEISGNHAGKIEYALELIELAAWAGADAVKFQCYMPERIVERRKNNAQVKAILERDFDGEPYIDLCRRNWTPWDWFPTLIRQAEMVGIRWFSSVFDPADVAFMESLSCPRYKISAFEMFAGDIHDAIDRTGKPKIVSIRPIPGVTILTASRYNGAMETLGLSAHGPIVPAPSAPMVEYHLRLPFVDTPDKKFSLMPNQLKQMVEVIRANREGT